MPSEMILVGSSGLIGENIDIGIVFLKTFSLHFLTRGKERYLIAYPPIPTNSIGSGEICLRNLMTLAAVTS